MCQSTEDLKTKADWDGAYGESRHYLLSELSSESKLYLIQRFLHHIILVRTGSLGCISPSVMLPEHRLAVLLQQVKQSQISNCLYHNTATSPSLYADHICDRNNFPLRTVVELEKHTGEVWQIRFSHDGSRLATCGSDGSAIIYEVRSFEAIHILTDHEGGVCSLAWSPDDSMLVTCSQDKRARLWNTNVSLDTLILNSYADLSSDRGNHTHLESFWRTSQ
jgi:WD40 repeat protein